MSIDQTDYTNFADGALPEAVVRFKIYESPEQEIYIESLTLESGISFRVLNVDSNGFRTLANVVEESSIKGIISKETKELINRVRIEVASKRMEVVGKRRKVNEPLDLVDTLVEADVFNQTSILKKDRLILKKDRDCQEPRKPGIPILFFGEYPEGTGWKLYLQSFFNFPLGFARWDDKDGILNLIATMEQSEEMLAMIALHDPINAARVKSRYDLAMGLDLESDRVQVSEFLNLIQKDLKLNPLDSFSRRPDYGVALFGSRTIAIRIFPPSFVEVRNPRKSLLRSIPWFAKRYPVKQRLSEKEIARDWAFRLSQEKDLWIRTVEEKLLEQGWYRVNLLPKDDQSSYFLSGASFFTNLSKELWAKIEKVDTFKKEIRYSVLDDNLHP